MKNADQSQKQYTFIFKSYQKNTFFWEVAILLRKVIIILISVFITSEYLQAYLGFLLLLIYSHVSYTISPYNNSKLNMAEVISLASSAFIFYSCLYFARNDKMDTVSYILLVLDVISGTIFVLYSLYVFFRIFKISAAGLKRQLSKIGSKILSDKICNNLHIQSHNDEQEKQQINTPTLLSPRSDGPNENTGHETLFSDRMNSDRLLIRPLQLPQIQLINRESLSGPAIKGMSFLETPVLSRSGTGGTDFLGLNAQRGVSSPLQFKSIQFAGSPDEEDELKGFSDIFQNDVANSPRVSVENRVSRILRSNPESPRLSGEDRNWSTFRSSPSPDHKNDGFFSKSDEKY